MTAMTISTLFSLTKGTPGYARLVYAGLLAGLFLPGLNVVAAVLAYLARDTGDSIFQSHVKNQLHIFGKSVVYVLIGWLLTWILIGALVIMAAIVWYVLRIVKGLQSLAANEPPANPESWLF